MNRYPPAQPRQLQFILKQFGLGLRGSRLKILKKAADSILLVRARLSHEKMMATTHPSSWLWASVLCSICQNENAFLEGLHKPSLNQAPSDFSPFLLLDPEQNAVTRALSLEYVRTGTQP